MSGENTQKSDQGCKNVVVPEITPDLLRQLQECHDRVSKEYDAIMEAARVNYHDMHKPMTI